MRCPFCGSHLDNGAKYCNDCGTAVDSECKGKNLNYRSYKDTTPNTSVNNPAPEHVPRPAVNAPRPNPFADKKAQFRKPPVSNLPSTAYSMSNVNTKKKSGCGVAVIMIIILFSIFSVVGVFLGEEGENIFDDNTTYFYSEYDNEYGDDNEGFVTDGMRGRFDGEYYLNDYVNIAFKIPDGFENISDSFSNTNLDLAFEKDDEQILTGYEYDESAEDFLERYSELVSEELESYNDGKESTVTDTVKNQVGENTFYRKTVYCGDLDGECDVSDIYATEVDGFVFFVEIDSLSPEFNNQILNSFVEAHTTD